MKKIVTACVSVLVIAAFALALWFVISKRSLPLDHRENVERWAAEYGVPRELVFAVIKTESRFDPNALSNVGAVGLMQLLPSTADEIARKLGITEYDLYDADTNVRLGTYYLAYLFRNTGSSWKNAVAAYNCGIGRVKLWLADKSYSSGGRELDVIPIDETRRYVDQVLGDSERYAKILEKPEGP